MSRHDRLAPIRRIAWRVIAAVLLGGLSMRAPLAQQASADAGGSTHVAAPSQGKAVVRHDAAPAVPLAGHFAARAPVTQWDRGGGLAVRGGESAPVRVPPVPPLVSSHGTIGGASFTRPGTALLPLGGPAKPAANSINGTSIRPKH